MHDSWNWFFPLEKIDLKKCTSVIFFYLKPSILYNYLFSFFSLREPKVPTRIMITVSILWTLDKDHRTSSEMLVSIAWIWWLHGNTIIAFLLAYWFQYYIVHLCLKWYNYGATMFCDFLALFSNRSGQSCVNGVY